jgi:hypothetical protein
LLNLLTTVKHRFSVIGITETWLRQEEHNVGIDGYNFVPNYRHRKAGGGVGLYLADHLEFTLRSDLIFDNTPCIEALFIEIYQPKGKNIVGIIYSLLTIKLMNLFIILTN